MSGCTLHGLINGYTWNLGQLWSRWDFGCPHHMLKRDSQSSCEFLAIGSRRLPALAPGTCLVHRHPGLTEYASDRQAAPIL